MTKKDYELIARAIAEAKKDDEQHTGTEGERDAKYFAYDKMARYIAVALKSDNTRFEYSRFMQACG